VAKDATFAPKERWHSWPGEWRERFDWLAGDQLRSLGYSVPPPQGSLARTARHTLLDWRWGTARTARLAVYRARVRVGVTSRPLRRRLGLVRDA
jgi:hypothetical protein